MYTVTNMARPRKLETLTRTISGRIRPSQDIWLRYQADQRFDGELSRALRWALDQAEAFTTIMRDSDPVAALDEMLHPHEPGDPEEEIAEAEREFEEWKHEQAIKRAMKKKDSK